MPKSKSKTKPSRPFPLSPETVRMTSVAMESTAAIPQKVVMEAMNEITVNATTDEKTLIRRAGKWLRENYPGLILNGVTAAALGLAIYAGVLYQHPPDTLARHVNTSSSDKPLPHAVKQTGNQLLLFDTGNISERTFGQTYLDDLDAYVDSLKHIISQ